MLRRIMSMIRIARILDSFRLAMQICMSRILNDVQAHLQYAAFLNFSCVEHARCKPAPATCARSAATAVAWRRATPSADSSRFRATDMFTTHLFTYLTSPVCTHAEEATRQRERELDWEIEWSWINRVCPRIHTPKRARGQLELYWIKPSQHSREARSRQLCVFRAARLNVLRMEKKKRKERDKANWQRVLRSGVTVPTAGARRAYAFAPFDRMSLFYISAILVVGIIWTNHNKMHYCALLGT